MNITRRLLLKLSPLLVWRGPSLLAADSKPQPLFLGQGTMSGEVTDSNRLGFVDITALTEKAAADLDIARDWIPGTLKDDGKRSGSEKGFRK